MKAILLLEDGTCYEGKGFGATGEAFGEVVFNTSMTGYQEILTDPSYRGQIVTMTYPLIGNYGVNTEDEESAKPWLSGFVVREASAIRSNWRSTMDLGSYLEQNGIVGIQGIDTRSLAKHLRTEGSKQGVISSVDLDRDSLAAKLAAAPRIVGVDLVKEVTCSKPYEWTEPSRQVAGGSGTGAAGNSAARHHVVVMDCGVKRNILRQLALVGCRVTVVPAFWTADQIMALGPDGLLVSNGPGDPEPVEYVVQTVRSLLGKVPIFGICLGHQMLGLAMYGKTYKLKFGHHGGNHPVKDLDSGAISITAQNHGFNVDADSIGLKGVRVTHKNLYDGTAEGLENQEYRVLGIQYHPESSPGPHDASPLFQRFVRMMERTGG